jgi:single-strand DNA-binding protein
MITITVAGNVGKDAVLRRTNDDQAVLNFSVASSSYANGEKTTQWVDVSVWGKRGQALADLITKGSKVTVIGQGSLTEHNGKTYIKVRAFDVELQGSAQPTQQRSETRQAPAQQRSAPPADHFDEDSIPF